MSDQHPRPLGDSPSAAAHPVPAPAPGLTSPGPVPGLGARSQRPLTMALPKGRILHEAVALLREVGIDASETIADNRKLIFDLPGGLYRVLVVRATDVPAYVEGGAADLGIAGLDVLREEGVDLFEPLDLEIGRCRIVVAEPIDRPVREEAVARLRIATKYPETARAYFLGRGLQVDIIKLHGSIELAPLVGLCDRIVDLVETGETLRQNRLWVTEDGGTTWRSLSAGLPAVTIHDMKRHPLQQNWLYVAAANGIFTSQDSGATWTVANDGPNSVRVRELFWFDSTTLVAATYGRGMFRATAIPDTSVISFQPTTYSVVEGAGSVTLFVQRRLAIGLGQSTEDVLTE